MKLEKIIVRIGGQLKFPFNVEAGNVVRIYRAPYAGFGKNGEWVPVTKSGGISTKPFHSHSFKSSKLTSIANRLGFDSTRLDCFEIDRTF